MEICLEQSPEEIVLSETQSAACWVNVREYLLNHRGAETKEEGGDSA
jgi:hypothetical protein